MTALKPKELIDQDDGDAAGCDLTVDDEILFTPLRTPYAAWATRGISKLFVAQLDHQEFAILERALGKVIIDCSFG